jgi:DNA-binding NarL/FixJ family response regulator
MKFLVVDDHALIRDAMRGVLAELHPGAQAWDAGSAADARALLEKQSDIDLVLLDRHLPDGDGMELLASLRTSHPATSVALLSGECDAPTVTRALSLGAVGYIPKSDTRDVLLNALRLILAGGVYIPPVVLSAPTSSPSGGVGTPQGAVAASPGSAPTPAALGLTDRQMDVLAAMMRGKSNKLICRELDLAEPTVKNHVSAILKALGVASRTEAVLAVTRHGWTFPDRQGSA